MKLMSALRFGVAVLGGVGLIAMAATTPEVQGQSSLLHDGKIGYVVSSFGYALADTDDVNAICPGGTSVGPTDIFEASPEGQRRDGETDAEYTARVRVGASQILTAPNGQNLCAYPEAGGPDPRHPIVTGNVASYGIDLDGQVSRESGRAASGTCPHNDFRGVGGVRGVDNEFMRALGCINALTPGGSLREFDIGMLTGAWGILIQLEEVEDLSNDADIVVRFYSNADPIQLSPTRDPVANASYAFLRDARYQAVTRGRIVNGVLTTEPVDARFVDRSVGTNDRNLRDLRLRVTIGADGAMDGILAGYSPVDDAYDASVGFRNRSPLAPPRSARADAGEATNTGGGQVRRYPREGAAASGFASTARHTCTGVYYALQQLADGHPDAQTGRCTSISTQYRFRAIPAFVVDAETRGLNDELERNSTRGY